MSASSCTNCGGEASLLFGGRVLVCLGCGNEPGSCKCRKAGQPGSWEPPVQLGTTGPLPAFPVGALPGWLADQVTETARFTQTPADLPASVALAVLSTAAGGRAVVEVRGSWREPVNLYTVVALPPGARKSAVFAEMTRPVLDTEASLAEQAREQILEASTLRDIALHEAERAARNAASAEAKDRDDARAEAIAKAKYAEGQAVPVTPRLFADDITPEAAASLLAEQGGRLAVLSAEGGIFAIMAGRYSKNGQPNLDLFLKGHSGDPLRVDRKGRPPEYVPAPALTLGLCVQPQVLRDLAALPGFRDRGLLARLLYFLPPDMVGRRRIGETGIPGDVRDAYADGVSKLADSLAGQVGPAVLTLAPAAAAELLAAERVIEPRLDADTGDLAGIRDWAAKQVGAVARIAGLLHLAEYPSDGLGRAIGEDTMRNAIAVGDYCIGHAGAVFDLMGADPTIEAARYLLRWIERTRPPTFTRREAHMGTSRSRFPKVGDLDAPLDLLEQHGYIRRLAAPERAGPGRRPSPAWEINPLITETT